MLLWGSSLSEVTGNFPRGQEMKGYQWLVSFYDRVVMEVLPLDPALALLKEARAAAPKGEQPEAASLLTAFAVLHSVYTAAAYEMEIPKLRILHNYAGN